MTLANLPVSVHNTFPPAPKAWARIAFFICSYGGEFNKEEPFYQSLISNTDCVKAVAELQAMGVPFKADDCQHWAIELCGSFEVTHPRYKPPKGASFAPAGVLYDTLHAMLFQAA